MCEIRLIFATPAVLTRDREDVNAVYNYLVYVMGLENSEEAVRREGGGRRIVHELRHSTRLSLVACPAWQLPLRRTVARHHLLLLANQWPPPTSTSPTHSKAKILPLTCTSDFFLLLESRDYIVGKLLTCDPEDFSYWLSYHERKTRVEGGEEVKVEDTPMCFSAADVRQMEKICENLTSYVLTEPQSPCNRL